MAEPFLSEVRIMSFVFAPKGWALCNGQLLPIAQNQGLFSLLGTTFGGDGRVNFALPDYRGRIPIHVGSGHSLGERGGEQAHTLSIAELPTHTHVFNASQSNGDTPNPDQQLLRIGKQSLRRGDEPDHDQLGNGHEHRRQPGAPEHAAVPDAKFLHRPAGHLPVAELRRRTMAQPYVGRGPHVRGKLRARRLDVLRRTASADLGKRDVVSTDRHDLWRRRREHVRLARPARSCSHAPG